MQILVILKVSAGVSLEQVNSLVKPEAAAVWQHYVNDQIRSIHYRDDQPGVVILLEMSDSNAATELVKTFPMVQQGVLEFEIIPLKPFSAFEQLFAASATGAEP